MTSRTPEAARVVIVGAAGFTNLGDDAILRAMLAELREALPEASFVVAGGPTPVSDLAIHEWIAVRDIRAVEAALNGADLAIVGGGGFVYDYDGILSASDFARGDITFMYPYYRAALAATDRGVPVYFYGIGVDSLVTPAGRELTRDVLSRATAITVRDELSRRELHEAGVAVGIDVTADPAVRLDPPVAAWPDRPAGRVVGFVPRLWLRFSGSWTQDGEARFARFCGWLADAADHACDAWDATPVFLAGQRYNDDDREAADRVVALMRHRERAMVVEAGSLDGYHAMLASFDAVVSARLHPIILAASAGVPAVGIATSSKIAAFLSRQGLEQLAVWPWSASGSRLRAALDTCFERAEPLRARVRGGLDAQRTAAARNAELAAELLAHRAA